MKKRFTHLIQEWSSNWHRKNMGARLKDLIFDFVSYLLFTLITLGAAAAIAGYLLPPILALAAVQFLALVYVLLLGIVVVRAFDREELRYKLGEIQDAIDHSNSNLASQEIDTLRRAVEELTIREGLS